MRQDDILRWMDSEGLHLDFDGAPSTRADWGWGRIVNSLRPRGISFWLVRAPRVDYRGKLLKGKSTEKSLTLGTNETKKERAATRNLKKIDMIHKFLNLPMGALGPPLWYAPGE